MNKVLELLILIIIKLQVVILTQIRIATLIKLRMQVINQILSIKYRFLRWNKAKLI
jgi:hypothetical protein